MQVLVLVVIALVAVLFVYATRRKQDLALLSATVRDRGGSLNRVARVRKGHPFAEAGRGWWVWQVSWQDGAGAHTSWVLTTREGIKEWRD